MQAFESHQIICKDGYALSADFYPAQQHLDDQNINPILICPATGISKRFYRPFAQWLSQQGFDVLCFDFRGIGDSLHSKLKDSTASIQDWGQLDIPAAIDYLLQLKSAAKITLIGHSAGGQLLGIVPNYDKVERLIGVSSSTGHVKHLKGRTKLMAPVMFKIIFPVSNFIKGYGATEFLGMGQNLPKNVARQWAQFCGRPGYVMNAVNKSIFEDYHAEIQCPITIYWSSDDEIATIENVKDLLRLYPNAATSMHELKPADFQLKQLGHMNMFRTKNQHLWPTLIQTLQPS